MRTLEEIDNDLKEAREELSNAKGSAAEVYSRIVGYYRSVRNWNKGKREEYGERKLYNTAASLEAAGKNPRLNSGAPVEAAKENTGDGGFKLLLFTKKGCPSCPGAKNAASKLGIPVENVDAASDLGFEQASRFSVMSTPTAILLSGEGKELGRAAAAVDIAKLKRYFEGEALAVPLEALKSA